MALAATAASGQRRDRRRRRRPWAVHQEAATPDQQLATRPDGTVPDPRRQRRLRELPPSFARTWPGPTVAGTTGRRSQREHGDHCHSKPTTPMEHPRSPFISRAGFHHCDADNSREVPTLGKPVQERTRHGRSGMRRSTSAWLGRDRYAARHGARTRTRPRPEEGAYGQDTGRSRGGRQRPRGGRTVWAAVSGLTLKYSGWTGRSPASGSRRPRSCELVPERKSPQEPAHLDFLVGTSRPRPRR